MIRARAGRRAARLQVAVTDGRGNTHPLSRPLQRWVVRHAPPGAHGSVDIALVSDRRIRTLNRTFRGVDNTTDVLSFPDGDDAFPRYLVARPNVRLAESNSSHLGDLAIAMGVAARQSRSAGHDVLTELKILALHGLLHLLGYDHERDRGNMRALEDRLRRRAGLPHGLIARTSARPPDR
jgi:probable rRNA maturation factor